MSAFRRSGRRGFVLLAVLVIVGCALLVATGIVFLVRGEVAGTANATDVMRLRAAAWSGVQAVAARLGAQRDRVFAGGTPMIDASITLWETTDETATARLLPIAPDGSRLVAEASRIDLRSSSVESLMATGAVNEDLAQRAIAARDVLGGGAVQPDALLACGGASLSPEDLYGPLDDIGLALDEDADVKSGLALERLLDGGATPRGLSDLLTGFAEEPSMNGNGEKRIPLAGAWDEDRRRAIDAALGDGSAALLEAASKAEQVDSASTLADLMFTAWRAKYPEPRDWIAFLDHLAPDDNPTLLGRLDVSRASASALRSLPGIDDERAARIVREREALPEDARRSAAWIAERGIVTADEFAAIAQRLTTRSVFWRVRIAVSFDAVPTDGPDGEASGRVAVLDAVIDLTSRTPRIALLRDVSGLETIARLAGDAPERDERASEPVAVPEVADEPVAPAIVESAVESATTTDDAPKAPRGAGRWKRTRDAAE